MYFAVVLTVMPRPRSFANIVCALSLAHGDLRQRRSLEALGVRSPAVVTNEGGPQFIIRQR